MLKRTIFGAFCVASLHVTCAQAAGAMLFSSEKLPDFREPYSGPKTVKALLNDGEMIIPGNTVYGPNTCPVPAVTRVDLNCTPPIDHVFLASVRIGQPTSQLPTDVKSLLLRFNRTGQMAAWSEHFNGQAVYGARLIDIHTGTTKPFFLGGENTLTVCNASDGSVLSNALLSDAGQLVGAQANACSDESGLYILSTDAHTKIAPPKGYLVRQVVGANSNGQIAANAIPQSTAILSSPAGFVWNGTSYKRLTLPFISLLSGFTQTEAVAINDAGTVAGNVTKRDGTSHSAVWQNLSATDIGTLSGFKHSMTLAINTDGMVLACAYNTQEDLYTANSHTKLFVWSKAGGKQALADITSASTTQDKLPEGCTSNFSYVGKVKVLTNRTGQWLLQYGTDREYLVSPTY